MKFYFEKASPKSLSEGLERLLTLFGFFAIKILPKEIL